MRTEIDLNDFEIDLNDSTIDLNDSEIDLNDSEIDLSKCQVHLFKANLDRCDIDPRYRINLSVHCPIANIIFQKNYNAVPPAQNSGISTEWKY